ncbi:MAG: FAD-dependent oxidoreductase, partial [Pseudomonadota bacterium]
MSDRRVIVVGSGSAALCAGIAALDSGAVVIMFEKATALEAGGNSRYTAGAMRFAYEGRDAILALLADPDDERIGATDFGAYPQEKFASDLLQFNAGEPLNDLQKKLIEDSYPTVQWLSRHGVRFDPIYSRQTFEKEGRYVFWGGLTLEARGEGVGLVDAELAEFGRLGGVIHYESECTRLVTEAGRVTGVMVSSPSGERFEPCDAAVLACGGFEASRTMREELMGAEWGTAK